MPRSTHRGSYAQFLARGGHVLARAARNAVATMIRANDRRRRESAQPVIEQRRATPCPRARGRPAYAIRSREDFSRPSRSPAIIPILTHPRSGKGEREQHA